jgi:hypothetical protein
MNPDTQYGYDLIENIIDKINDKSLVINYNSKEYIISLKTSENNKINFYSDNYELKLCKKKNLKPNYDLPSFYSSILLKNIINEKICLTCKNNLYIMLLEKIEENNKNIEIIDDNKEVENDVNNNKKVKIKINKKDCKYDKDSYHTCKNICIII